MTGYFRSSGSGALSLLMAAIVAMRSRRRAFVLLARIFFAARQNLPLAARDDLLDRVVAHDVHLVRRRRPVGPALRRIELSD